MGPLGATSDDDWHAGRITDVGLAEMRSQIGSVQEITPWITSVTEEAIWHFASGIGDDNPMWWDRAYAEGSPAGRMFAPPTLLYALTNDVAKPHLRKQHMAREEWLKGTLSIWAGDRWNWHSRLWLGEELTVTRELHGVRESTGRFAGRSIVQTELLRFTGGVGQPVADLYRTTMRFEREGSRRNTQSSVLPETHYSAEDRARIIDQYALESARRQGRQPRHWEDVMIGEELSPLVKGPLTITNLIGWILGWGSSQCPTNRMLYSYLAEHPGGRVYNSATGVDDSVEAMHWDQYFARESGMDRGFDFGGQRISWAAHVLTDWGGDEAQLIGLEARLKAPNYLGDTTWFRGTVTDKWQSDLGALVTCHLTGVNQRGTVTITADGTMTLPTRR
jgi:acyl dehydratase